MRSRSRSRTRRCCRRHRDLLGAGARRRCFHGVPRRLPKPRILPLVTWQVVRARDACDLRARSAHVGEQLNAVSLAFGDLLPGSASTPIPSTRASSRVGRQRSIDAPLAHGARGLCRRSSPRRRRRRLRRDRVLVVHRRGPAQLTGLGMVLNIGDVPAARADQWTHRHAAAALGNARRNRRLAAVADGGAASGRGAARDSRYLLISPRASRRATRLDTDLFNPASAPLDRGRRAGRARA